MWHEIYWNSYMVAPYIARLCDLQVAVHGACQGCLLALSLTFTTILRVDIVLYNHIVCR